MRQKALLLAAGKGTRLWPLTEVRAKAAVPYRGVPLVRALALRLLDAGIRDIAVNLHHLPETVEAALRGIPVTFSHEDELLGTSGALHPLRGFLEGSWFWTINAKIATDEWPPIEEPRLDAVITAVVAPAPAKAPFTRVDVGGDPPRILGLRAPSFQDRSGYLFTGIQLVSPRIWDFLPAPGFSHFPADVYPRIIEAGGIVGAHVMRGQWREFSTLERYLNHHVGPNDPTVWRGEDSHVAPGARVTSSVLWDRVVVEHGAVLHRCIVADGVTVRARRRLEGVAIVPLARVRSITRGEILDDTLVVPLS